MRSVKYIAVALLVLSVLVAPAWTDTDINRGSVGISQATADDTYATLAGEDQYTKAHDFSVAELIAADATKAGHVVTRGFGDSIYAQLGAASNTFTGVQLLPDGSSGAPSIGFASESGTGWHLSKALTQAWTEEGTGTIMTLNSTKGLILDYAFTVDGSVILGDARTDDLTIWPDQIDFLSPNDHHFAFTSDALFDGAAIIRFAPSSGVQVASELEVEGGPAFMTGSRLMYGKGSDVASADEITLGAGNYFDVTGTTTINHITKTGWQAGSVVVLQFDASVTVTHNAGSPAGTEASILLAGAGDFSATANDTLHLVYDGTTWREIGRAVI